MEFLMRTIQFPQAIDELAMTNFRRATDAAIQSSAAIVLVDFQQVEFISSPGLMVLVQLLKRVRASDKKLFICSVNEKVQMLLDLTGMNEVFEIFVRPNEANENEANQVEQLVLAGRV
jgi:anti-sigma B factor antagonist